MFINVIPCPFLQMIYFEISIYKVKYISETNLSKNIYNFNPFLFLHFFGSH